MRIVISVMVSFLALVSYPIAQDGGSEAQSQPPASSEQVVGQPEQSPSLADLARREEERRARYQGEVRVITNSDLRSLSKARIVTGVVKTRGEQVDQTVDIEQEEPAEQGSELDLEFWTRAFSEAKTNLQNAVNQVMVLELRMNNLRNAYLQESDGGVRERQQQLLAESMQQLEQARAEEQAAREAIEELRTEATRAGLTPGKIRDLIGQLPQSKSISEDIPQRQGGTEAPQTVP